MAITDALIKYGEAARRYWGSTCCEITRVQWGVCKFLL